MTAGRFIRDFYESRSRGDVEALRSMIAGDVVWREPDVDHHMGELNGVEAVLDMIGRAMVATDGTFSLRVAETIEVDGHCAAIIEWSALKGGETVSGRELASFTVRDGKITFAQFLPENIADDRTFWD